MPLPLSAADWIRLKRLKGGSQYTEQPDKDVINVSLKASPPFPFPVRRDVGSSKTRRETSKWIDFVASQSADYILNKEAKGCASNILTRTRKLVACNCSAEQLVSKSAQVSTAVKWTGCQKCKHLEL